ncbi:MAG: hypothetical protein GYA87_05085 [Christensenellaceae bacterium]|nr:hypothetical protein [Christensenellaceae bacterium]
MKKTFIIILLFLLLIILIPNAIANELEAKNIIKECKFSSSGGRNYGMLSDNRFRFHFSTNKAKNSFLEITAKEDIHSLYIMWQDLPGEWLLQENVNGEWFDIEAYGKKGFLHEFVEVPAKKHIRILNNSGKAKALSIFEMEIYGEGELPKTVQIWEEAPNKCDILVLVAHPDDEYIFMGGLIPSYLDKGKSVMVSYLTHGVPLRRFELLNGLWHCSLKNYPVIGNFADVFRKNAKGTYATWGKEKSQNFVANIIRQHRPEVVVTHDINGEYGHGAHKAAADIAINAVKIAEDNNFVSEFSPWQTKKLYLHLGENNTIKLDWEEPLNSYDGKTALQVAAEAYQFHESQHGGRQDYKGRTFFFKVEVDGMFDSELFSLVHTRVGEDINKNDFLENID